MYRHALRRGLVDGHPVGRLLAVASCSTRVEPTADAKYVAFETLLDPARMPGQKTRVLDWPYVEGLRLDEAMHPLALLATGLYGEELPPQDGAPVRLVAPWKYGFKGIKSIVKITLSTTQPPTTWNRHAPQRVRLLRATSTRITITRAGVRRPSSASANRAAARR